MDTLVRPLPFYSQPNPSPMNTVQLSSPNINSINNNINDTTNSHTINDNQNNSNDNDNCIPSILLILEPVNKTFTTKELKLSEGTPIVIGRATSKSTTPRENNGYFTSKVLSRRHAEIWCENNKVCV